MWPEEEAAFNNKLAEFLSRKDASTRCHKEDGSDPCFAPMLYYVCHRVEPGSLHLRCSGFELLVKRYVCLSCGAVVVAAIEREKK